MWPCTGPGQPPFTLRPGGWPGPVQGHTNEVLYLDAASAAAARPGGDAAAAYEKAYTISTYVIG